MKTGSPVFILFLFYFLFFLFVFYFLLACAEILCYILIV